MEGSVSRFYSWNNIILFPGTAPLWEWFWLGIYSCLPYPFIQYAFKFQEEQRMIQRQISKGLNFLLTENSKYQHNLSFHISWLVSLLCKIFFFLNLVINKAKSVMMIQKHSIFYLVLTHMQIIGKFTFKHMRLTLVSWEMSTHVWLHSAIFCKLCSVKESWLLSHCHL